MDSAAATSSTNSFTATSGLDSMVGTISSHQTLVDHPAPIDTDLCKCLLCYYPGCLKAISFEADFSDRRQSCTFPGCDEQICLKIRADQYDKSIWKWSEHEICHYGHKGKFGCQEERCTTTTKTFTDLKRHYASKHCKRSKKHACHHIGCKYSGDNGFTRKDKLKSHLRNVHEGKVPRGQPPRAIKPKTQEPAV